MSTLNTARIHPDGYLEVTIVGDQTYLTYDQLRQDLKPIVEKMRLGHQDIFGLVDFSKLTSFEPSSIKGGFEILESIPYKKVAFFGANAALTAVVEGIIVAIGRADDAKIFADRAEAIKWLMG